MQRKKYWKAGKAAVFALMLAVASVPYAGEVQAITYEEAMQISKAERWEHNTSALGYLSQTEPGRFVTLDGLVITDQQYEEIQSFTLDLIKGASTDREKIKKIYDFLKDVAWNAQHKEYILKASDNENDPWVMFALGKGVCQGYSNLGRTMCTAAGIPCIGTNGYFYGNGFAEGHAWNFVYCDGKWGLMDGSMANLQLDDSADLGEYYIQWFSLPFFEEHGYQIGYHEGIAVVGYVGNEKELIIPEKVGNENWIVTTVCPYLTRGSIGGTSPLLGEYVERMHLPKTVTNFVDSSPHLSPGFLGITVDGDNPVYSAFSGALYNKDYTEMLYLPYGVEELELKLKLDVYDKELNINALPNLQTLKIPEGVKKLDADIVVDCPNLERIYIPDSVETIDHQAFGNCKIAEVYAPEGSAGAAYAAANGLQWKDPAKPETPPTESETPPTESETLQTESETLPTEPSTETEQPVAARPSKPQRVTKLKVRYGKKKKITLSWKKVKGADGYEIRRLNGKKWVKVKRIGKKTSAVISLKTKKTYRYRVCAYKKISGKMIYGALSKAVKVKKK